MLDRSARTAADTTGRLRTRAMDTPDPAQATTLDEFAGCLRHLYLLADKPSYRTLEHDTAQTSGLLPGTDVERVPLRRSTLGDVLAGRTFPRKAFLLTFLEACGITSGTDQWTQWVQTWEQLVPKYLGPGSREDSEPGRQQARDEASWAAREIVTAAERKAAELLATARNERYQILSQARATVAETRDAALAEARDEAAKIIGAAERRAAEIVSRAERDRDENVARAESAAARQGALIADVIMLRYRSRDLVEAVSDPFHLQNSVGATGAAQNLARGLDRDISQLADLATKRHLNDLAGGLAAASKSADHLIRHFRGLDNAGDGPRILRVSNTTGELAGRLANSLAAVPIDASDADLKDLHLPDLGALAGIVWTDKTVWPESYRTSILARSLSLRPGVFEVRPEKLD